MPSIFDRFKHMTDQSTQFFANEEAQASWLKEVDKNQDGKVNSEELRLHYDANGDGYLDTQELQDLALKAGSSDFDDTTIKALGQAVNSTPKLTLFAESEGTWTAEAGLQKLKDSYTTSLPYRTDILPSRQLDKLTGIRPGLFQVQEQVGNSCGTTSLSMVMKYFQGHNLENSVPNIDQYIRANGKLELMLPVVGQEDVKIDGFTAPRDVVSYARARGFRAGLQNDASVSQIKGYLDKGVPVMCLTDWNFDGGSWTHPKDANPDAASLHWVTVLGYTYQPDDKGEQEMQLVIGNPNGVVQHVSQADFEKVWTNLQLGVGNKQIETGMNRLMVAMVPKDEDYKIVAPDGNVYPAGDIGVPDGSDGIRGWVAQKASAVIQYASEMQDDALARSEQLASEAISGFHENGVLGAINNLWNGDAAAMDRLHEQARKGGVAVKAEIINGLLDRPYNRENIEQLVFDILKETPWGNDFNQLIDKIDTHKLVRRLDSNDRAGRVMAWIGRSEVERLGKTGPKFEAFASYLSDEHRDGALKDFLENKYTQEGKILQKAPPTLVRGMVQNLMNGITDADEEHVIYELFRATSWPQFDQVMSRLDMRRVASELEDSKELGNLTAWVIQSGLKTHHWDNLSEILNQLDALDEYTRADNVLGQALTHSEVKGHLAEIPSHLRQRMADLLDDLTRLRSDKAVVALKALRQV